MAMQDPDDVAYRIERFRAQIQNLPEDQLLRKLEVAWESVQAGLLMQEEALRLLRHRGVDLSNVVAAQKAQLDEILQKLEKHGIDTTGNATRAP
jgi:hypothetical protein